MLVGYDAGNGQFRAQDGCRILRVDRETGVVEHDCDTLPLASGSPLFQGEQVVAVHAGSRGDGKRNVAFALTAVVAEGATDQGPVLAETSHCGSDVDAVNSTLKRFVIPDYFPPDAPVSAAALNAASGGTIQACVTFGRAGFGNSCFEHDRCYDTLGTTKRQCDSDLRAGWIASCKDRYNTVFATSCRNACLKYAGLAAEIQAESAEGDQAFKAAQDRAAANGKPVTPKSGEDQYLVGDFDGDRRANIAVRRGYTVIPDSNFDGYGDDVIEYGNGNSEHQYLAADFDGDRKADMAVRRGNTILIDLDRDGVADRSIVIGNGQAADEYVACDFDGDGKAGIAVRYGNTLHIDEDLDGVAERTYAFGQGTAESQYLYGDFNGDRKCDMGVRRGNEFFLDYGDSGAHELSFSFGDGDTFQYFAADFDGDGKADIAARLGMQIFYDLNRDGVTDLEQQYGNGG